MRHGPVWHYLLEVGHFHYMMDEHISEYSSFEAHLCLFSVTYWGIPPSLGSFNLPQVSFTFQSSCWPFWVAILGHTPFLQEHQTFHKLHSLFDLVVDPRELHTGVYPPSQESLDLSKASLSFDLVVDPHELPYWGISPPIEFTCIVILVILWLWATWSSSCLFEFSLSFGTPPISISHHLISLSLRFGVTPISIDHIPISLCSVWVRTTPISIGHHFIILSLHFGAAPISINHIPISLCSVWVGIVPISINHHLVSLSLCVLGPHPYRSVIFLSVCVQFELGPHLYRSVIILLVWVYILGVTPISIDHYLVSLSLHFGGRTHIDQLYSYQFVFSLSWDYTYIDRSSSCQFGLAFWGHTNIDWPYSYQFVFSLSRDRTYIDQSSSCQFEFAFWGRTHIDRPYSYQFVFSLSRGRTYIYRSPHLLFSVWVGAAPISICHLPIISMSVWVFLGPHLYRSIIHHFVSFSRVSGPDYYQKVLFCRPNYNGFKHLWVVIIFI